MSRSFLTGRFLPAHGQSFARMTGYRIESQLTSDELKERFDARRKYRLARRAMYVTALQGGLAFAIALLLLAMNVDLRPSPVATLDMDEQELVQMEEIVQTVQIERPPPPPRPPVPVAVPDDTLLDDDVELDLDALLDLNDAVAALPPPPPPAEEEVEAEPEIFTVVEHMPELVGGYGALMSDVRYPEDARRAGIDGTVVVQVIVGEDGKPLQPAVVRSVHPKLDEEAIRAIMEQQFKPGMQRSRPVKVRTNISVRFRLVG